MTEEKSRRVEDYVEHVLVAAGRIDAYVAGLDLAAFLGNFLVQDAVIRNLEIIGEAANKIQIADPSFAQGHPELRLDLAYRMRNALIHGYDAVNLVTFWNTVQSDLPVLKQRLAELAGP